MIKLKVVFGQAPAAVLKDSSLAQEAGMVTEREFETLQAYEAYRQALEDFNGLLSYRIIEADIPALSDEDLKIAREYESRFFDGGAYADARLRFAEKDSPIRQIIRTARENYNGLRTRLGLPPVTAWDREPDKRITSLSKNHEGA